MSRKRNYEVEITDPTLDRPVGPADTPLSDHRSRLLAAEQDAQRDAGSQAFDQTLIQYLGDSPLPAEAEAQRRLEREQSEATKKLFDARSIGQSLAETGKVSLTVNGPGLPRDHRTTIAQEAEKLARAEGGIAEAEATRTHLVAILDGTQADAEGVVWTGHAPGKPGPDTRKATVRWSAANLRDKALSWLPLLVLGPVEAAIVVTTLMVYLRTDDVVAPIALAVAFLVGLILLPGLIGQSLAKVYRRGFAMGKELWSISILTLCWLAAVASTVFFRVSADRDAAIRKAAKAQDVPIDQVNAAAAYDVVVHVLAWLVPVGLIGFAVIGAKVLWHNPVIRALIRTDLHLIDLFEARFRHASIQERAEALIAARAAGAASACAEWEHFRDQVLPAQSAEYRQTYRTWLCVYCGDPNITNGLFPKAA